MEEKGDAEGSFSSQLIGMIKFECVQCRYHSELEK
jgi:hypothetical protein